MVYISSKYEPNPSSRLGGVHGYTHRHTEKLRELEYRMSTKNELKLSAIVFLSVVIELFTRNLEQEEVVFFLFITSFSIFVDYFILF